jgi:antitoxin HicB
MEFSMFQPHLYPATVERDGDGWLAEAPDLPMANGVGSSRETALADLMASLESCIVSMIEDREVVPLPSPPKAGQATVALPALASAKIALYRAMLEKGWRKADLARALGVTQNVADRLVDLNHASKLDHIERALLLLGKRLVIAVDTAA